MRQADPAQPGSKPLKTLAILLALVAWLGTGLTLVPNGERAIAGGQVLQPGPHWLAPWPLSRITRLDDGAVRDLALPAAPPWHVVFRIGLPDAAARQAAAIADPDRLVASLAAAAALPQSDSPARAASVRTALAARLAAAGLDLLAVTATPSAPRAAPDADPAPALIAARAQAADMRIEAKSKAASAIAAARARAAEIVDAARTDLVNFTADQAAARVGGRAFLLERYFANLSTALARSPKTIIDHRLNWPEAPELDLRPPSSLGTGEAK